MDIDHLKQIPGLSRLVLSYIKLFLLHSASFSATTLDCKTADLFSFTNRSSHFMWYLLFNIDEPWICFSPSILADSKCLWHAMHAAILVLIWEKTFIHFLLLPKNSFTTIWAVSSEKVSKVLNRHTIPILLLVRQQLFETFQKKKLVFYQKRMGAATRAQTSFGIATT